MGNTWKGWPGLAWPGFGWPGLAWSGLGWPAGLARPGLGCPETLQKLSIGSFITEFLRRVLYNKYNGISMGITLEPPIQKHITVR
jgi:hypothetical protein